eukprot:5435805-Alexandrium_andersonii.AAC.1
MGKSLPSTMVTLAPMGAGSLLSSSATLTVLAKRSRSTPELDTAPTFNWDPRSLIVQQTGMA